MAITLCGALHNLQRQAFIVQLQQKMLLGPESGSLLGWGTQTQCRELRNVEHDGRPDSRAGSQAR